MNLKHVNYILLINIFIFLICLGSVFAYNQLAAIENHDYWFPFQQKELFQYTRVPPFFIEKIYYAFFPSLFQMHPADFEVNFFVCLFTSFLYMLIVLFFSRGFYVCFDKYISIKEFFQKKETIFLLPICFLIVSFCARDDFSDFIFLGINDSCVFLEYLRCLLLYWIFFITIFSVIVHNRKLNPAEILLYSIIGFILAVWSEFINLPSLFAFILIVPAVVFRAVKRIFFPPPL